MYEASKYILEPNEDHYVRQGKLHWSPEEGQNIHEIREEKANIHMELRTFIIPKHASGEKTVSVSNFQ